MSAWPLPGPALALAWVAVVLGGAVLVRAPRRVRQMAEGRRGAATKSRGATDDGSLAALGAWLLARLGREARPAHARRMGSTAVSMVLGAVMAVSVPAPGGAAGWIVPAGVLGWKLPGLVAGRQERRRLEALAGDLPDLVDLMVLAVGSGATVHQAVDWVADRAPGPLGAELAWCRQQQAAGRRLADALEDLPSRAGEAVRPLVAALVASDRYGAALGSGLDRLAGEVRSDRRRAAEEAARKVPVKLLFPLICCTLPAFGLLTVVPLIVSAVGSLEF